MASARTLASALPAADADLRAALIAPAVLHARPMNVDVATDGYPDDWGSWHVEPEVLPSEGGLRARLFVGRGPGAVNLWLEVDDDTPVSAAADGTLGEHADHVDLWLRDRYGERRWRVARMGDGVTAAQPMPGADGRQPSFELPAAWIERGFAACQAAGVSPDYFVERYLEGQDLPRNDAVEYQFRQLIWGRS